MNTRLPVWILFVVALGLSRTTWAQDKTNKIIVTISTVKESDWQREASSTASQAGLRERLQARTLVELGGELKQNEETVLRTGEEHDIVTQWGFAKDDREIVAEKTIQELIGTEVRVVPTGTKEARLRLTLTHDLQPPQMHSMTYATAAIGMERDKLSVTAPRFERLRWQGEVTASKDERVIASFPAAGDADTRLVVFLQGGGESTPAPAKEIRQTIYRVPELDMIEWLLDGSPSDAALVKRLQDAVTTGRTSVVSRLTSSTVHGIRIHAQAGSEWRLPSEMNPDYDRLYQVPSSFETALSGTRLEFQENEAEFMLKSTFAQRAPLVVKWPTSWLHVHDQNYKPTGKAIHGWMDWHDRFEQEIIAEVALRDDSPHLVAMLPPADQLWGAERQGRWLDVTVMQQVSGNDTPPKAPEQAVPPERLLLLGIALDHDAAQALLATRPQDESLLRELVERVKRGEARVQSCAVSANEKAGVRRTLASARQHVYPTEMPSIPSAWGMMPVGTRVEMDGSGLVLTQDLAPPARTEWKLAQDVPEAIMWEPRFRKLSLHSAAAGFTSPGTRLCAVADIPAVMSGGDLPAHETVLLFTHRPANDAKFQAVPPDYEVETMIFEISAGEAEDWQEVKTDDFASFTQQRLKQGTAKLQSRTLQRVQASTRSVLSVAEEYLTATEFDPPEPGAPLRMRPTALETLPVGLHVEVEVAAEADGIALVHLHLKHSTARPIEPGLEETLKIAASGKEDYPGAKHEFEEWRGDALLSPPGTVHCLGLSIPPGSGSAATRVAFVRVRPAR
jgi:hypothetical protein